MTEGELKLNCLRLAFDLNRTRSNLCEELLVKSAGTLYAFLEPSPPSSTGVTGLLKSSDNAVEIPRPSAKTTKPTG